MSYIRYVMEAVTQKNASQKYDQAMRVMDKILKRHNRP